MTDKNIDLPISFSGKAMQDLRAEVQAQATTVIKKPTVLLGDPSRHVVVGCYPEIPKDLLESD